MSLAKNEGAAMVNICTKMMYDMYNLNLKSRVLLISATTTDVVCKN